MDWILVWGGYKVIVIEGKEQIADVRLLTLLFGLKLELKGMTRHGRSAYSIIKQEQGLKGCKQSVYDQYVQILRNKGLVTQ